MNCLNCGIEIEGKKVGAKYCSPRCRKQASRKASVVTDNVTLRPADVTLNFEFTIAIGPRDEEDSIKSKSNIRTAKYWYDVPLAAIPVIKKDWPKMPSYMNGRQYFLWWKNNFEEKETGPVILDPYPQYEKVEYVNAGEGSRRWGT